MDALRETRDQDVMPRDEDAERAVLGAVMVRPHLLDEFAAILGADDFQSESHRITFATFQQMRARGEPIDDLTVVCSSFRAAGLYDRLGGIEFFQKLLDCKPANASHYASVVCECSRRRNVIRATQRAMDRCRAASADDSADSIIASLMASLRAVESGSAADEILTIAEVVRASIDRAERAKADVSAAGIRTGIHCLDSRTGGLFSGLTIIAARPSMGKSAIGFQCLSHAARNGVPSLFISIEMNDWEVGNRVISAETGHNSLTLRSGKVSDDALTEIKAFANNELQGMPLYFWRPKQRPTIERIAATIRMHALKHGTRLVAIDHLLKIRPSNPRDDRHQQITDMIVGAKDIATELDIPVLMLTQAKRKDTRSADKSPTVDELFGSSMIEAEADDIWLIHRDNRDATSGTINIGKCRNGQVQCIDVGFDPVRTEFHDITGGNEY